MTEKLMKSNAFKRPMVKDDFDYDKLEDLGYYYSIMEGGYISKDRATIVVDEREPYIGQVCQYKPTREIEHEQNIKQLRDAGFLAE